MFSFLKKSFSTTDSDNKGDPAEEEAEPVLEAIHEQELFRWKETVYDIIRVSEQGVPETRALKVTVMDGWVMHGTSPLSAQVLLTLTISIKLRETRVVLF